MSYKLGSLFDGSGGFPLSGTLCNIEPMWAAEIEPYPIAVTSSRFPNIKHLGDISRVNGAEIEPVDIITFGSPCQDLSVAGKRAGLKHEDNGDDETTRSGLFMEAVRIIKEMRGATNGQYPRFAVWENVPGAFSSNNGEDFRIVLQELIKIAEPNAVMPDVPQKGWAYADSYCGDGWSLAYRVFDAQYWGVPQRRRRIYLVADFRGQSARKVLFEREGLRGYFETGRTPWKAVAADAERSVGADDCEGDIPYTLKIRSGVSVDSYGKAAGKGALIQKNMSATLAASQDQYLFQPVSYAIDQQGGKGGANYAENVMPTLCSDSHGTPHAVAYGISAYESNAMKSDNPHSGIYEADTSRTLDGNGGNPSCNQGGIAVVEPVGFDGYNQTITGDKTPSITGAACDIHHIPGVIEPMLFENNSQDTRYKGPLDVSPMLPAQLGTGGNNTPFVVEQQPFCKSTRARTADDATTWKEADVANTLNTFDQGEARANERVVEGINGDVAGTLDASYYKGCGLRNGVEREVIALDRTSYQKITGSLCARDYKGVGSQYVDEDKLVISAIGNGQADQTDLHDIPGALNCMRDQQAVLVGNHKHYIVRRLTPTECARLQGFPDNWGHPDAKTELTDDEYKFWLEVRNTHAAINEKPVKDYSRDQMLTWYNKLHTDSAEYKMWGNGIALPCALYVMQGIKEALADEQTARSKWLDDLLRM